MSRQLVSEVRGWSTVGGPTTYSSDELSLGQSRSVAPKAYVFSKSQKMEWNVWTLRHAQPAGERVKRPTCRMHANALREKLRHKTEGVQVP